VPVDSDESGAADGSWLVYVVKPAPPPPAGALVMDGGERAAMVVPTVSWLALRGML